jgi:predicted O-methyltransferase YrrM
MTRRLGRLLSSVAAALGCGRGFFIPHRQAPAARRARGAGDARLERLFRGREAAFRQVLAGVSEQAPALSAIGGEPPPAPRWRQDWFPRLDAAVAYAMVRRLGPSRIVEVGAGHSTRFFARAVADGRLGCRLVAIDPEPRAAVAGLAVEAIARPVQETAGEVFQALAAGDVLSVDSSHVLMPGTDVDVLLNRVLPALPPGVLVHLHDVFLPDDYPPEWHWRGYNEQLGVALLLASGAYEVLWSSHYVATRLRHLLAGTVIERLPLVPGARESSLWIRKAGAAAAPAQA